MQNKLCIKQVDCFFLVYHICIRDKDHQMSFKRHKNYLISLNHACFIIAFSSLILFDNVNNSFKGFHKL